MYSQIDSNKRKTVLLIGVFIVVIMVIGWFVFSLSDSGPVSLVIAAVVSLGMSLSGYFYGDKLALATSGAKPVTHDENPYLARMVENLCITAGLPTPKIHVIHDAAINAFACGRDPAHASIAVTTGALERLENEELEGVIAHELSHVKNYDIRVMTIVIVLVGILALLSDWFLRFRFLGRDRNHDSGGRVQGILMIIGIILLILSPLIGRLIQFAVSRKREFLADAPGALLMRYPEGLARALEKIHAQNKPVDHASSAIAHLYISNPFGSGSRTLSRLFSTHPPVEERIAALRRMA